MFSIIHQRIRDAQARFHTGYQDIRAYHSNAIAVEPSTTTPALMIRSASTQLSFARHSLVIRWYFQHAKA
jgi:hypothetical protein